MQMWGLMASTLHGGLPNILMKKFHKAAAIHRILLGRSGDSLMLGLPVFFLVLKRMQIRFQELIS
ncbi:hypothetical protein AXG94_20460 [Pseudomonas corrugata]|nr:hypothetical protein AXG94_20460 [Pseudomonas corrugata]